MTANQPKQPFPPYKNAHELHAGKRGLAIYLTVAVAASLLAVLARHTTNDPRLVHTYIAAALIYLTCATGPVIRWSNTREVNATAGE